MPNANEMLVHEMLVKATDENVVQAKVDAENLRGRRARWVNLTAEHLQLFPQLTVQYMKDLTFGTFQVYLAPSYIQDSSLRIDENDELEDDDNKTIQLDQITNEAGFIRIRLYSRFRNATKHQIWISYNEDHENDLGFKNEDDPILGYYCTCKAGARTLGTCSHVASILWYLGYARHENNIKYP